MGCFFRVCQVSKFGSSQRILVSFHYVFRLNIKHSSCSYYFLCQLAATIAFVLSAPLSTTIFHKTQKKKKRRRETRRGNEIKIRKSFMVLLVDDDGEREDILFYIFTFLLFVCRMPSNASRSMLHDSRHCKWSIKSLSRSWRERKKVKCATFITEKQRALDVNENIERFSICCVYTRFRQLAISD